MLVSTDVFYMLKNNWSDIYNEYWPHNLDQISVYGQEFRWVMLFSYNYKSLFKFVSVLLEKIIFWLAIHDIQSDVAKIQTAQFNSSLWFCVSP